MGDRESKKNNTNNNKPKGCPAEYNLLENQLCELKKYTSCTDQNTGITKYKVAEGCAPGYIDANDCLTKTGMYVCGETPCGNCHEEKCSDQYKDCSSDDYINAIGSGSECEEKYERYYDKKGNNIKYSECICDVTEYPYTDDTCAHTLSGAKCKGDYGTYWKNCIKICEYEDKDECESTNKNFACIEVDGCYEPNGCKADYELVNNECIKSNPCEAYPYTSCPASAIKCETCENNGTTYYKAITCDESQGYYHSDGECKPRDCSDFTWDTCPPNSSCDSASYFNNSHYVRTSCTTEDCKNDVCISAGQVKYQLSQCAGLTASNSAYLESGTEGCIKRKCENFDFTSKPQNANYETCANSKYSIESCKSYHHYQNGSCVVYGDKACVNHKLTEIPANAEYTTCSPDGGTTKYYQFTYCKSGYNFVDGACVEPSGVTETDYPFTTEAECEEGDFLCTYSNAIVSSKRRYKRTRCAYGFHYDNGVCIENDCSAYPFRYDRFDSNSPYMSGPSCEKPLPADGSMTDPDSRLTYIMLRQCEYGYKFDPNGTDCIKSIIPPELLCHDTSIEKGRHASQETYRLDSCAFINAYHYWNGCVPGYYFNGQECVANKCADFPFTSRPENSREIVYCKKGDEMRYRALSCLSGYRLNNHDCEPELCEGYPLAARPSNANVESCYSSEKVWKYRIKSCYNNYQLIDGVCVKK